MVWSINIINEPSPALLGFSNQFITVLAVPSSTIDGMPMVP